MAQKFLVSSSSKIPDDKVDLMRTINTLMDEVLPASIRAQSVHTYGKAVSVVAGEAAEGGAARAGPRAKERAACSTLGQGTHGPCRPPRSACAACRTHLVDAPTLGAVSCLCACLAQLATTVSDTEVTMCANEQVRAAGCGAEVGQACRDDPSGSKTQGTRG